MTTSMCIRWFPEFRGRDKRNYMAMLASHPPRRGAGGGRPVQGPAPPLHDHLMIASPRHQCCKMDDQSGLCSGLLPDDRGNRRLGGIDDSAAADFAAVAKRRQNTILWKATSCDGDRHG